MSANHFSDLGAQASGTLDNTAAPLFALAKGVDMMGSEASLRKILKTVNDSMTASLPQIAAALQAGDVPTANNLLHAIKGYLPIFASDALAEQVAQVEKISKTEAATVVAPLYAELGPQLESLLQEVRQFLAKI